MFKYEYDDVYILLFYLLSVIFLFLENSEYFALWLFLLFQMFFSYQIIQTFTKIVIIQISSKIVRIDIKYILVCILCLIASSILILLCIFYTLYNKNTDKISFGHKKNTTTKKGIKIGMLCSVFVLFIIYFCSSHIRTSIFVVLLAISIVLASCSLYYSILLYKNTRVLCNDSPSLEEEREFNWIKI
jgi:hypothetical protein